MGDGTSEGTGKGEPGVKVDTLMGGGTGRGETLGANERDEGRKGKAKGENDKKRQMSQTKSLLWVLIDSQMRMDSMGGWLERSSQEA